MRQHRIIQVDERLPLLQTIPLSLQHLFAMFGSTVLGDTLDRCPFPAGSYGSGRCHYRFGTGSFGYDYVRLSRRGVGHDK